MARTRITLTLDTELFPPSSGMSRPSAGPSARPRTPTPPPRAQPIPDLSGTAAEVARWAQGLTRLNELLAPTVARRWRLGLGHVYTAEVIADRVKPVTAALTLPNAFLGMGAEGTALARGTSAFKFAESYARLVPGAETIVKGSNRLRPIVRVGSKVLGGVGVGLDLAGGPQGGGAFKIASRVGFNALGGAAFGPGGALILGGLTLAQELGASRLQVPLTRAQLRREARRRGLAIGDSIAYGLEHGPGFQNGGLDLPPEEILSRARPQLAGLPARVRLSAAQRLIEWTRMQQAAGNLWPGTTSGVMAQFKQAMPRLGGYLHRRGEGSPWQLTRTLERRGVARAAAGQVGVVSDANPSFAWALGRSGGDLRQRWLETMNYLSYQTRRGTANARSVARQELGQMTRVVKDNSRQMANWLAHPFTQPLASSIHKARSLTRGNVAAVITQLRLLSPQMRQVTAAALRDQVSTMERHKQTVRGTTRGLVMAINSQWPRIAPASRRAVTRAILQMSASMVDGRRILDPQAVRLAEGVRAVMRGRFGRIVTDFGAVVADVVSTAQAVGTALSSSSGSSGSSGSIVTTHRSSSGSSSPPPTYRRQAKKFRRALGLDGGSLLRNRRGGYIPALVSSGERVVHGRRSWLVPGARTAADNVLAMLPVGAAVLTDHGQALMAAGFGLDDAVSMQLPHFGRGTAAVGATARAFHGGASVGGAVSGHLWRLVGDTVTLPSSRPSKVREALRDLGKALRDTENVTYHRLESLGSRVRREMAALKKDGVHGTERLKLQRLRGDLHMIGGEMDRRIARGSAHAQWVFESNTSTPERIASAIGRQRGRRSGLFTQLDRARARHDRRSARAIKRQIRAGRQAHQQRLYDQKQADLALDDLALSADPNNQALRDRKQQHLEGYRAVLARGLEKAKKSNDYAAIVELSKQLEGVGESIKELTDATQDQKRFTEERLALDKELVDNQKALRAVAESQPNVLLGGLVAAINGDIGGKVGLGVQTPGFPGRGTKY